MSDTITVYSDYVCPFCFLGRKSLEQYQAEREDELDVDWHPFDLRAQKRGPDGEIRTEVDDGKDEEYYEQAKQNVRRLKEEYGVEMTLDLSRDIDSLDAQVASYYVEQEHPAEWPAFDWGIFDALWQDGRDIGDHDVLRDLAADVGLDPDEVLAAVEDDEYRETVRDQFRAAQEHGVTGVPTFTYDQHAARGAVPPAQLRRLVEGTE